MRVLPWLIGLGGAALCWSIFWLTGIPSELFAATVFTSGSANLALAMQNTQASADRPAANTQITPNFDRVEVAAPPTAIATETARQAAADLIAQGYRSLGTAQCEPAIKLFAAAIRIDPQSADALIARGQAYDINARLNKDLNGKIELDNLQLAYADFSQALLIDPQSGEAYRCRCNLNLEQGNFPAAQFDAAQWARVAPLSAAAYVAQGKVSLAMGDISHAIGAYTQAIHLPTQQATVVLPPLLLDRADLYSKSGDYESAMHDLKHVIDLKPVDKKSVAAAQARAGRIEFARGNFSLAASWFRSWCDNDQDNKLAQNAAWYDLGTTLLAQSDFKGALSAYDMALEKKPADAATLNNRGIVLAKLGKQNYQAAISDFTAALTADPNYRLALENRASIELSPDGNAVTALADYKKLVSINPNDARLQVALATSYIRVNGVGDLDRALTSSNAAINIDPSVADAYLTNALANARKSRTEGYFPGANTPGPKPSPAAIECLKDAVRMASEAIRRSPNSAPAYRCRAYAYSKLDLVAESDADSATAERLSKK